MNSTRNQASLMRSFFWAIGLQLAIAGSMQSVVFSQDSEKPAEKPRSEIVTAKDGWPIALTYWPSKLKQDACVVVLLHGLEGNQLDWGTLPKQLQDKGYAVINVDLRGHGQSKKSSPTVEKVETKKSKSTGKGTVESSNLKARDFEAMYLGDMEAVKHFILEEHQKQNLNMNKTAIVGAGMGGAVALKFAAFDWLKKPYNDGPVGNQTPRGQDIRAVALLTVDSDIPGLTLPDAIKILRNELLGVAIMFGVGKKDKQDKGQSKKLYDLANTPVDKNKDRMYLQEYNTAARGTGLLAANLPTEGEVTTFLENHLKNVRSEWRDRESRVGKKTAK